MTRSFIILTLLVGLSTVDRYVSAPPQRAPSVSPQQPKVPRDAGLKPAPKLPRTR